MSDIWQVPQVNYGLLQQKQPFNPFAQLNQPQQKPAQQQPGQPLNIQSPAQQAAMNPSFWDRMRAFFTDQGTTPQPTSANPPVVSGTADSGLAPDYGPVYGRQAGGPVVPGYARRMFPPPGYTGGGGAPL